MTTVYLNGKYVPKAKAMIPVEDRGFIFGDGIYEVVRVIEGRIFAWDAHAERLANGLAGLRISSKGADSKTLRAVCERLIKDNALGAGEATVYLQVSRGAAPRVICQQPLSQAMRRSVCMGGVSDECEMLNA